MVMAMSWYIKGTLLDTTNRSFVSTVNLFLFFFSTNNFSQSYSGMAFSWNVKPWN